MDTFDENGEKIMYNQIISFIVGGGGFGGPKQSSKIKPVAIHPKRNPDVTFTDKTFVDQVKSRNTDIYEYFFFHKTILDPRF